MDHMAKGGKVVKQSVCVGNAELDFRDNLFLRSQMPLAADDIVGKHLRIVDAIVLHADGAGAGTDAIQQGDFDQVVQFAVKGGLLLLRDVKEFGVVEIEM